MPRFVINPPVFFGSVAITALFLAIGVVFPNQAEAIFAAVQSWILETFGWLYLLAVGIFIASVVLFAASRFGDLKLGPDDSTPDFRYLSWVAMLFAAGMGIGLMYFAVGEPMKHFAAPPEAAPLSIAAQRQAMSITFFHWGLHAWAIYAVVGLSLAYFGYRYNLPLTVRSGLYPLLGSRIDGPIGHAVDIFAICGTLFGIATSLGLGVLQINAGLTYLLGVPNDAAVQIGLIAAITAVATVSVVTGLDNGVRRLSELNLALAVLLMSFVLAVGPTAQLLRDFVQNIGFYLDTIVLRTFNIYAYEPRPWIDAWTLFYWAWWISWSPFVGMFIARISRGRTVREFVIAVLFVPAGFTFFWMTVFGNTALWIDTTVAQGALHRAVASDLSTALFHFFQYLPFPMLTSSIAVMLVAVFFVTSADSGSLVVDTLAAGGATDTTTAQRVFWCALEGLIAAVLLLTGGLAALQSATIATALPFSLIMLVLVWALFKGMAADVAQRRVRQGAAAPQAYPAAGLSWQRRLGLILNAPTEAEVGEHIKVVVTPALDEVRRELEHQGRRSIVTRSETDHSVSLNVPAEGVRDFVYGVRPVAYRLPAFSPAEATHSGFRYEARTFFSDGSRGYDVMGMTRDQVIADVLAQFDRYLQLVTSPAASLAVGAPEHKPQSG
ncbi:choline/glycine/proline betaine transport protein [Rhodopseudomonas thermotolerans]|uniref:Choline/glycine/proline betaine transport protein n=2 Tax=Rhodopseudomonas TaxID=1073 RepID=A0A336JMN6_9BRAD|nr:MULTISPECIES: BCCT family transporter [Rhodopseudomonas]RED38303.1 choline/glycine/proline betaine transport protein [Rhodopseudomonas pentothenatexigens]REG05888.1 choline/glycine/proline betaine transport protein [Rhodopseudomonas thermotolerans]SSW89756.1 choline/glycine/proline betaine transport protein [Rhodopseudomonas pentothenatexigens]